jgi:hypothetical protein
MSRWVVVVVSGPPPKTLDPLAAQPAAASALPLELLLEPPLELPPSELVLPLELVLPPELPPLEALPDEALALLDPAPLPELLARPLPPDDEPPREPAPEDEPAELPELPELSGELAASWSTPVGAGLAQAAATTENPVVAARRQ